MNEVDITLFLLRTRFILRWPLLAIVALIAIPFVLGLTLLEGSCWTIRSYFEWLEDTMFDWPSRFDAEVKVSGI